MTPKQRRDRIFHLDRPSFRPIQIFDGERYHRDLGILWASHQKKPFYELSGLDSKEDFAEAFVELVKNRDVVIAEDRNRCFKNGSGPVAVISTWSNGWRMEPHAEFFAWATPRNILRTCVSFFQVIRCSRSVACGLVLCLKRHVNLFRRVVEYGVLVPVGRVPQGDPRGDLYLFVARGRKKYECQSRTVSKEVKRKRQLDDPPVHYQHGV